MGNLTIEILKYLYHKDKNAETDKSLSFTFTLTMPTIIISRLKLQYVVTYFATPLVNGPKKISVFTLSYIIYFQNKSKNISRDLNLELRQSKFEAK